MGHQSLNILTLIETKIEPLSLKFSILEEKVQKQRVCEIWGISQTDFWKTHPGHLPKIVPI